ncbi:MAG: chemotaxis response regulator protein-glutamate methylesterase [Hungatella sp.]
MNKKIRVLVVDDSILFRKLLIDYLSAQPYLEVVGFAINAYDAKQKLPILKPDVMTLDVEMPGLNGIEFVKQLIPKNPIPVILVSSLNLNVFEALSAGAVDFVRKPDLGITTDNRTFLETLANKVVIASRAKVMVSSAQAKGASSTAPIPVTFPSTLKVQSTIIAIGASTGGTEATLAVLKQLPADCPGIVITQHMPEGFTKMYAERLNRICAMEVREAQNGDRIQKGLALIAPGNLQMKVVHIGSLYTVSCFAGEKVSGHTPSVDVLFNSMADAVGRNGVGILLTGMGRDGADGLLKMRNSGAYTIGQNKETCVVYGMPTVAYNIGGVCIQSALNNIPSVLKSYLVK